MARIWHHPLNVGGEIIIPVGKVVHAGERGTVPTVWVEHAHSLSGGDAPPLTMTLLTVGTGWEYDESWIHEATFQSGAYVWHVLRVRTMADLLQGFH